MTSPTIEKLAQVQQASGSAAAIDELIDVLQQNKDYHKLFDALLLKKKYEMGLPLTRPTSLDDVPDDKREEFEKCYIDSARKVGQLLLDANQLPDAWIYFRTIREPEPVRAALDAIDPKGAASGQTEALMNIALYEGAHPVKGLEIMLYTNGTCNTVTAMDQAIGNLAEEDRKQAAAMMVKHLYEDLCETVRREVEQRMAMIPPDASLRELTAGRDWLFEGGNYHIDVSHLNAVVRFARALDSTTPELALAIQLAEYGTKLDPQFQYAGDPPFQDFYQAHLQFFKALADEGREEALAYFQDVLNEEPDFPDKQMIAFGMIELLLRIGRTDEAVELASEYLSGIEEDGFSYAELCAKAGRMDKLQEAAKEKGDAVAFVAALVQSEAGAVSA